MFQFLEQGGMIFLGAGSLFAIVQENLLSQRKLKVFFLGRRLVFKVWVFSIA